MHERRLMEDFMDKIESVAKVEGATRVTGVHVRLGKGKHFFPLAFAITQPDAAHLAFAHHIKVLAHQHRAAARISRFGVDPLFGIL